MKKKYYYILSILVIVIFGIILGINSYKKEYLYKGRFYMKDGFVSDTIVIKSWINGDNQVFFDNLKKENKVINISLLLNILTGKDEPNGIRDNFILEGYGKNCFYFIIPISKFEGMEKRVSIYGKNKDFSPCNWTEKNDCYVISTERGLLSKEEEYSCN